MVEKFEKDEELTDEELKKATGGTDQRQPIQKGGHIARPEPEPPIILVPRGPETRRASGNQISAD